MNLGTKLQKLEKYARPTLRIGLCLVFFYFSSQQFMDPDYWASSYVPQWALPFGLSAKTVVLFNACAELIFGILLLLGLFTRISALILSIHLFFITISLGYSELGARDFGLMIATFSVFMSGPDQYCLDKKLFYKNL